MTNFFNKFRLGEEKESLSVVTASIENGVVFRGTNLWVLIFAIFLASLGLNMNAPSVIIGAMLISPLMGPIMGIGLSMGINDVSLMRKSLYNYGVATGVALATSTVFFFLSPLGDAHSEILARTRPSIYDVLIAFFGGMAGIVAASSRNKGNVVPGVAIATALMPPLCTAGYGIATWQWSFFFGAFYLFLINTVFIALSTLLVVRLFHFPVKHFSDKQKDLAAKRIVWFVVIATLIPSIYLGYDLIREDRYTKAANRFIQYEAHFENDYLLNKRIDPDQKKIILVFGGATIDTFQVELLRQKLPAYGLGGSQLEVRQGFSYIAPEISGDNEQIRQLRTALAEQERLNVQYRLQTDSILLQQKMTEQLYAELRVQYPKLETIIAMPVMELADSTRRFPLLVRLKGLSFLKPDEKQKIEDWLKVRTGASELDCIWQ